MSAEDFFYLHFRKIAVIAVGMGGLAAFGLTGCPGVGDPEGTLTGQVTSGGQPVRWGTVTVIGSDNRSRTATIRSDGSYTVDGLPPGPVRVSVASADPTARVGGVRSNVRGSVNPGRANAKGPIAGGPNTPGRAGRADARAAKGLSEMAVDPHHPVAAPTANNAPAGWFPIPGKYADPNTSGIGTTVQGSGQFNITVD